MQVTPDNKSHMFQAGIEIMMRWVPDETNAAMTFFRFLS
jgi:hypothetical protein